MSDPVIRLNAALEGRYAILEGLNSGDVDSVVALWYWLVAIDRPLPVG